MVIDDSGKMFFPLIGSQPLRKSAYIPGSAIDKSNLKLLVVIKSIILVETFIKSSQSIHSIHITSGRTIILFSESRTIDTMYQNCSGRFFSQLRFFQCHVNISVVQISDRPFPAVCNLSEISPPGRHIGKFVPVVKHAYDRITGTGSGIFGKIFSLDQLPPGTIIIIISALG